MIPVRIDQARRLILMLLLGALPVLLDPAAPGRAVGLLGAATSVPPLDAPGWILLHLWAPLVATSALALVLAPGLLAAFAVGEEQAGRWVLHALAWSTVLIGISVQVTELMLGRAVTGRGFVLLVIVVLLLTAAVGWRRVLREAGRSAPWSGDTNRATLLGLVLVTFLLLTLLAGKVFWESFNGDGAHAYESARLLLHHPVPFWPAEAGGISSYPGLKTFLSSYPVSWFIRLFGEIEAAARIPYALFLVGLYGGLIALIESGRARYAATLPRVLVWLGLTVFTLVMAYSATYNPYHADLALPGTEDTLFLAWCTGFILAFLEERAAGIAGFAVLTYTTSPGGLIILGLWCAAAFVLLTPRPWRACWIAAGTVVGCMVLERAAPGVLTVLGLPVPGNEHATGTLAQRLTDVQWRDIRRAAFVLVPGGILPALWLLTWSRQDRVARVLTVTAIAQFLFFYLQARISLHYFVPAMVLPLVVLYRDHGWTDPAVRRRLLAATVAGALVAGWLSLPPDLTPHLQARVVGSAVLDEASGYDSVSASAIRRGNLLTHLFPGPGNNAVPEKSYGGSPLEWYYYAHRGVRNGPPSYLLRPVGQAGPAGAERVADDGVTALYVLDGEAWRGHQGYRPAGQGLPSLYRIPKATLFFH